MKQRVMLLTNIIGNFVGAICKHPEEDSVSAADWPPSFVHSGCYENTTSNTLHEDITCNRQVLPEIQTDSSLGCDHSQVAIFCIGQQVLEMYTQQKT